MLDLIARASPEYVESLYREYQRDPASVDPQWALVFAGYELGASRAGAPDGPGSAVADLVHHYRELGHLVADIQPLDRAPRSHPLLRLEELGLGEADLDRVVDCRPFRGLERAPLRTLLEALAQTYTGTIGVEYMHIADKDRREWLQDRMETTRNRPGLDAARRQIVLDEIAKAEVLEQFLHTKYVNQKRFSLEGGEALIPLLDTLVEDAAADGVQEMVLGMPHRGRLNVLAHTLGKPLDMILAEFEGTFLPWDVQGDGDVKYHLGYSRDHTTRAGRAIHLSMSPNPSHLEAVNPVVEGIVRAKQAYLGDDRRTRVMPVLLHGEAAFMGQGSVYETLAMSALPGFATGGTVHVVVNNQVGFTTAPEDYRFSRYPTDLARVIEAPVFHVNGDDPEAAVQAARLATAYRQAFGGDAFIDLVCYRRHGHNELDDPTFTQPVLYEVIRQHPSVARLYADQLVQAGVLDAEAVQGMRERARRVLDEALVSAREHMPRQKVFAFGGVWQGLSWAPPHGAGWAADTAVPAERLQQIAKTLTALPEGFTCHKRLRKLLEERADAVSRGAAIDWGTAEHLAYGSLLLESMPVRLCGQDSIRGTFSHRHAALYDAENGATHVPLNHIAEGQARIELVNSLLSETGALGFEYGMSSADPRRLVIWEAQFGDFANGAQGIIDQFIASAESKWQRMSGLVLLLPHGYEGQGPEHSSGRLERFLQLCADDNLQVVNCTTSAQLFHALRRQVRRPFRKPLVVMSPKSLLRHPGAASKLADFTGGRFELVLGDPRPLEPAGVERVLLCAGKIFHVLDAGREERDWHSIAIVRVEQLYPWPAEEIAAALARYPAAHDVCWVQEEPANQGAWSFAAPRLERLLGDRQRLRYVGRDEAASPATGSYAIHQSEEAAIVERALRRPRTRRASSSNAAPAAPAAPAPPVTPAAPGVRATAPASRGEGGA